MDVVTVYLNAEVVSDFYMEQHESYNKPSSIGILIVSKLAKESKISTASAKCIVPRTRSLPLELTPSDFYSSTWIMPSSPSFGPDLSTS